MLNRNKSYGEVNGSGIAYKFEQDGKYFNQMGYEVTADGRLIDEPKTEKPKTEEPVREFLKESTNIDLDDLTSNEIRDMLDRYGVKHRANDRKPDLLASLREEILNRSLDEES